MRETRLFAYALADYLHILDVDEVLALPYWKLREWQAYFNVKKRIDENNRELEEKTKNAKTAAQKGGW